MRPTDSTASSAISTSIDNDRRSTFGKQKGQHFADLYVSSQYPCFDDGEAVCRCRRGDMVLLFATARLAIEPVFGGVT
jgi:hypothetical protein